MSPEPIAVIGIGPDGPASLSALALDHIACCRVLAGGRRHLDLFPDWHGERLVINAQLERLMAQLRERSRHEKTVVLASGDPLFFGIGRALLEAFPKEELHFFPSLGCVQVAFAHLKETWNDAVVISLHGRPIDGLGPALREGHAKIAVLTDANNHPAAIAQFVRERGLERSYTMWVCENVGGRNERLTEWSPGDVGETAFAALNLVVLLRQDVDDAPFHYQPHSPVVGIPEEAIRHRSERRGLITKREVRLIALCHLELPANGVFWDVGSGSGSVSLEAARLAPGLQVYAVERDPEACSQIEENLRAFALPNVHLVRGQAPEALVSLPVPDAVFVGGSGGRLLAILDAALERLAPGGRLVLNCITLQSLSQGWQWLSDQRLHPEVTSVQIARSRPLGGLDCLEPENPVFVLRVTKP